jgi:branched-chain amino acid transport system substrate-binding protein
MVGVLPMPYACAVRFGFRPDAWKWLLVALCALASFAGCPSGGGGPSIARLPSLTSPDPEAEAELRAAQELDAAGKTEQARARYERFLVQRPKDPLVPVAQLALGRILLASDKPREATSLFDSVATHPDSSVAEQGRFLGAIASSRLGEHAQAVKVLRPMVGRTVDPADTRLLLDTLAGSLLALERYAEGITVLDRACKPLTAAPRSEAQAGIDTLVRERARAVDIERLYDDLPHDGCAWPSVVRRAVIDADARGDADEARDLLEVVRENDLPMDDVLSSIAMRADRPDDADPRVIGAVLSLSGQGRRVGELALRGLMLAAGLPPSGPLPKDAPQLVFRDDGGDPQRAAAAVEELATIHRAIAIIGPLDVRVAPAASAKAKELGVPLLLLTPAGALDGELSHRMFPTPEGELAALLDRAVRDKTTRVAMLLPAGPYGDVMGAALRRAASSRGATVVAEQRYAVGATAFGRECEALAKESFDALFIADQPTAIASIAPALAAAGLWSSAPGQAVPSGGRAIRVLSVSAAFDPGLARSVGRYLQGALFSVPFHPLTATGGSAAFAQSFQARFGEPPDTYAAFSHDAYRLLRAAVSAGGNTRSTLARELQRVRATDTASPVTGFLPSREAKGATRLLELEGTAFIPSP